MGVFMKAVPADDSNSLVRPTTSLLIEVAFAQALLPTTALETRNRDGTITSVSASSLHHLDNIEYYATLSLDCSNFMTLKKLDAILYLFCSKVVAHLLADQVGFNHGEGVVTQTAPRAVHIHLHYLAVARPPSPTLIESSMSGFDLPLSSPCPPSFCS